MRKQTTQPLAPHLEQIARALRKKIDGRGGGLGSTNLITRRTVSRLAALAGTRRLVSHSDTFARAVTEIERRGRESFRDSQNREIDSSLARLARYLEIPNWTPPAKPPKAPLPPLKRQKGIKRIRVNGSYLEDYGVNMGDRLLVASSGDIRPGELGYFDVWRKYEEHDAPQGHAACFFLFEIGKTCPQNDYTPRAGVCLRTFAGHCTGRHVGGEADPVLNDSFNIIRWDWAVPLGRVVGVERDRRPVETTLPIRPYDEREGGPASIAAKRRKPTTHGDETHADGLSPEQRRQIKELREKIARIEDDDQIRDEGRIFRLEREIYNIEQYGNPTEWPDWIPG